MKLSVIIPNRNDTVMLAITVKSAVECLKCINSDGEIIVVDNSDPELWNLLITPNKSPLSLRDVQSGVVKLLRQPFPGLYSAVQTGSEVAHGEYIYRADAHTLFGHNHFKPLVDFMDDDLEHKVGCGFAPIGWVANHERYSRHDIRFDKGKLWDNWGRHYDEPTKICWNFGSRIMRRDWWLNEHKGYGFFADKRIGWGGGEFYVAVKSWLLGKESWAIPTSPQYHMGPWSDQVQKLTPYRYHHYSNSGTTPQGLGILCALYALGGDEAKEEALKGEASIRKLYGIKINDWWPKAKEIAEDAWTWMQANQKISFQEFLTTKPWAEGWDEKTRWMEWKPDGEIPKMFNLKDLKKQE